MYKSLKDRISAFRCDSNGQIAVITAIAAVPVMLGVTLAIDYGQGGDHRVAIQAALDSAGLATVANGTLKADERIEYADAHFKQNFSSDIDVSIGGAHDDDTIDLWAKAKTPTLLGGMIGKDDVNLYLTSKAKLTKESVTCLLALDPEGEASLQISGKVSFYAPNCAVQVNSNHPIALSQSGPTVPRAQSVCVTGGYQGNFLPHVNTECTPVADPYANINVPQLGACVSLPVSSSNAKGNGNGKAKANAVSGDLLLMPGNYCGGLALEGPNIRLAPGLYDITDGPLTFSKDSNVFADNVTFILRGTGSLLEIDQGATVNIIATRAGKFGGLAFYQIPTGDGSALPENKSFLKSGGNLNVTGVVYLPTHEVTMTGQAGFGSQAPATSFIAYNIKMSGKITANIKVDDAAAGIAPMMPRVDGGPVLVR